MSHCVLLVELEDYKKIVSGAAGRVGNGVPGADPCDPGVKRVQKEMSKAQLDNPVWTIPVSIELEPAAIVDKVSPIGRRCDPPGASSWDRSEGLINGREC